MEVFGNYKIAQIQGSFRKSVILRPFGGKFEKYSTRKLFVSEKRVQRKWNRCNRSSFGISRAETRNFPPQKISEIRDTETFRIAKFSNLRDTIPTHSKYYFITLEHLFVHSRHVSRLNFDPIFFLEQFENSGYYRLCSPAQIFMLKYYINI